MSSQMLPGRDLSFGQPVGGLIQLAYTVRDLDQAMLTFTRSMRVGPWFVLRDFGGLRPLYRGTRSSALSDIALGFVGHIQIELIQPKDDHPSVYRETIAKRGHGFHHFGVAAEDFETALKEQSAKGYELAFSAAAPGGGRVAIFDTSGDLPGMIELIEAGPALEEIFGAMQRESVAWDGTDWCCQSDANLSPIGGAIPSPALAQATRLCHSASAAERRALNVCRSTR